METFSRSTDTSGTRTGGIATGLNRGSEDGNRFLQVQTLGSIFAIYGGNWRTISLTYAPPMLLIALLHAILLGIQPRGLANIVSLIFASIGLLTGAMVTVMISDLCLGLQPSVWRSYCRGFANIGRLIGTYFLGVLFISLLGAAGALLLIVPGLILRSGIMLSAWFLIAGMLLLIPILILTVWYMFFIVAVVVLEKLEEGPPCDAAAHWVRAVIYATSASCFLCCYRLRLLSGSSHLAPRTRWSRRSG